MSLSLLNHSALALFAQRTRIPTSARSIGFCAIWVFISSSSSSSLASGQALQGGGRFSPITPDPPWLQCCFTSELSSRRVHAVPISAVTGVEGRYPWLG